MRTTCCRKTCAPESFARGPCVTVEEYHGGYSHFTAPDGAPEDVKKQILNIQNNAQPKSKYSDSSRITSLEFARRKTILSTLSRLLSEVPQQGASTTE